MRFSSTLVSAAAFFELCIAGYVLEDDFMTSFYDNFNFFTGHDPTNGFVDYVDEATARQSNLINGTSAATFGVDVTNKTPSGRPSLRLESKKKYSHGLIVVDVAHMPTGCGTWPAFWTLGSNWPKGGEIDIIEGVNECTNNGMTLHTGPGCEVGSDFTQFSGEVTTQNCDVAAPDQGKNVGCSIKHPSQQSYGAGLNENGGGVYATSWNADAISIWFFPRESIPADVLGDNPNPSGWGKPSAKFAGACDITKMFAEQQIIIDTTFCGDWAGSEDVWDQGTCGKKAKTCNEYVRDNPQAFTEAYWEINALRVYQDDGKPQAPPAYSAIPPQKTAVAVPVPISSSMVVPPASSQVALPSSASLAPEAPSKPTVTPAVPAPVVPTPAVPAPVESTPVVPVPVVSPSAAVPVPVESSSAAVPGPVESTPVAPSPSQSNKPQSSVRPPSPVNTQPNTAPIGPGGLPGWVWPSGGELSAPEAPDTPAQNKTGAPVEQSEPDVMELPSNIPPPPAQPSAAPPAVPYIPNQPNGVPAPVHTVYHTVYVTKVARAEAAATPDPAAVKARMARHIREHKRRGMQHNAHF